MELEVSLNTVYKPSEDVVVREVQGEFIIVPITSGIGDLEDGIFTLNNTGRAVWGKMDGKKNLKNIVKELSQDFKGSPKEIEEDVLGLTRELLKRKIFVKVKRS